MSKVKVGKIIKPALTLLVISGVASGVLGVVSSVTAPAIAAQEALVANGALLEVYPDAKNFKELELKENELSGTVRKAYSALDSSNKVIGYVVEVFPKGFGGEIDIMVGVDSSGVVKGISILSMAESPGLGARAVEPIFKDQFVGATSPVLVTKDGGTIESITSATITSRAVSLGVTDACDWALAYGGGK